MKDMIEEINKLRIEKDALILAHYYQDDEVQDIADFTGDSLELSKIARDSDKELIIFAGVHFMGETAKILAPHKTVLMPDLKAGCPMADRAAYDDVKKFKEENPDYKIVCYVNSSAAVKSLADVCVTSSSAVNIMNMFAKPGDKIMYVPDKNLGQYLDEQLPNINVEYWPGFCCIHEAIKSDTVDNIKKIHPNTPLIMHPECHPESLRKADYIGSTSQMIKWVWDNKPAKVIVATEKGVIHQMKKKSPDTEYILASQVLTCRQMRKVSMDKILHALKTGEGEMKLTQNEIDLAIKPLELMMDLAK